VGGMDTHNHHHNLLNKEGGCWPSGCFPRANTGVLLKHHVYAHPMQCPPHVTVAMAAASICNNRCAGRDAPSLPATTQGFCVHTPLGSSGPTPKVPQRTAQHKQRRHRCHCCTGQSSSCQRPTAFPTKVTATVGKLQHAQTDERPLLAPPTHTPGSCPTPSSTQSSGSDEMKRPVKHHGQTQDLPQDTRTHPALPCCK
jgi:hypothetical protein